MTRARHKRMNQAYPDQRDAEGRRICCYCLGPLKGRQLRWCGQNCVTQAMIRCSPQSMRLWIAKRDQGICASCGVDTEKLIRVFRYASDYRQELKITFAEKAEMVKRLGFSDGYIGWEADHIREHSEGGELEPENIQTLCTPCHKTKTKLWRGKRRRQPRLFETAVTQ